MILTDSDIIQATEQGSLVIEPFSKRQVQPASYDLRVGRQAITSSSDSVVDIEQRGFFELTPGDFAVVTTREKLEFDLSHTARIGLCSKYARKGIIATTGPQVDPGYRGRLKIGLTNLSPHSISFPFEDDLITLEIHRLTKPAGKGYSGPYQDDEVLSPDDIASVTEGENIGFSSMLDSLQSLSMNVGELTRNMERFTTQNEAIQAQNRMILWVIGLGLAAITLLVAFD
ncbi:MAG: hypothetical protein OXE03_02545 [Gammaproteobacteria bacterium]|nr:hypothetical protein [Gammaproteobacteria bacterium]